MTAKITRISYKLSTLQYNQRQSKTQYFQLLASIYYRSKGSHWYIIFKLPFFILCFWSKWNSVWCFEETPQINDTLCHVSTEPCFIFLLFFFFWSSCTCLWCEVRFQAGMNLVINHLTRQCCRRTDQVLMLKGWLCLIFHSPQAEPMMVSAAIRLCFGQDEGRTQSQRDHICLFATVLNVRVSSGVLSAAGMLVCR